MVLDKVIFLDWSMKCVFFLSMWVIRLQTSMGDWAEYEFLLILLYNDQMLPLLLSLVYDGFRVLPCLSYRVVFLGIWVKYESLMVYGSKLFSLALKIVIFLLYFPSFFFTTAFCCFLKTICTLLKSILPPFYFLIFSICAHVLVLI